MPADALVDGARCALIAVFVLSAAEKTATLCARSASWHPMMLVSRSRRRHATALMLAALGADLTVLALLAVRPMVGAVGAAALVASYTALALPVHAGAGGSCRCLWKLLDSTTATGLLARNAMLFALALGTALWPPSGFTIAGGIYGAGVLLAIAMILAVLESRLRRPDPLRAESATANDLAPPYEVTHAYAAVPQKGGGPPWS